MHQFRFLVTATALLSLTGCSGDGLRRVPVEGRVTAQEVPVGGATILFLPADQTQGEGGIGTSDPSGNFSLVGSRQGATGVVPGKYLVRVSRLMDRDGTVLPADAKQADYPHAAESIPPPYSSANSPLEVTVPETGGTVNVQIPVKALGKK